MPARVWMSAQGGAGARRGDRAVRGGGLTQESEAVMFTSHPIELAPSTPFAHSAPLCARAPSRAAPAVPSPPRTPLRAPFPRCLGARRPLEVLPRTCAQGQRLPVPRRRGLRPWGQVAGRLGGWELLSWVGTTRREARETAAALGARKRQVLSQTLLGGGLS